MVYQRPEILVGTVMGALLKKMSELPGFRRIGDDRERNVHVSDDVDFVRVLNVVDDEFARIEPGLAVVCAGGEAVPIAPKTRPRVRPLDMHRLKRERREIIIASCEFGCEDSARIPSGFTPFANSRKEVSTRVRGRH